LSRRRIIHIGMSEDEEREYIRTLIFVDIIGLPFTPLSFAGVARPSARRAYWYRAAAALRSACISGVLSAAPLSVLRLQSDPISIWLVRPLSSRKVLKPPNSHSIFPALGGF
jgi:hypothetical protein